MPKSGSTKRAQDEADRCIVALIKAGSAIPAADGERYRPKGAARDMQASVIEDAIRRDLLRRTEGGVVPTEAGVAWARRQAAEDAPFREQHGRIRRDKSSGLAVEQAESPLAWLYSRRDRSGKRLIGDAAFAAGERLRADFTLANLTPRMSIRWDASPSSGSGGGAGEMSDTVLAAQQRMRRALDAVGPELNGVLVDVCCFLKGLEEVERDHHWPARSGKLILGLALAGLARHYGLGEEAVGTRRAGRIEAVRKAGT